MLISNRVDIARPRDEVFEFLLDLGRVGTCLPGAILGPDDGSGVRDATMDVKFGPMQFSYEGTVRITGVARAERKANLEAEGRERSGEGTAKAELQMTVVETDQGSALVIATRMNVTGGIAQIGRGMFQEVAQELIEGFGEHVTARLGRDISILGADEVPGVSPTGPAPQALDARKVLFRVVARQARGSLRRTTHAVTRDRRTVRHGETVDLAVAGSGSGALTAAIAAHDAGLSVAIYEKAPVVGGGTAYSGGVVWAPCNHIMHRKGIQDSVEDAMTYLAGASDGRGDEALQRRYIESVGAVVEAVESWTGINWVIWPGQPDYYSDLPGACANGRAILQHPNSAHDVLVPAEERHPGMQLVRQTPHMDFVPGFQTAERPAREAWVAGRAIIGGLWKAVLERGIPYSVGSPLRGLTARGGRVSGVLIAGPEGPRRIRVRRGVLLNTGGFDWNRELARRYLPGAEAHPQTPPSNTGDGLSMAMAAGAATALMDKALLHPALRIPGDTHDGEQLYRMFNAELSKPHGIVVDRTGRRFASEAAYFDLSEAWNRVDHRFRTHPHVPSYLVFDDVYRERYGLPCVRPGESVPEWMPHSDSLEGLAEQIDVDPVGLVSEVADYNRACADGTDPRFDRGASAYERYWGDPDHESPNPTMGTVERPPFYAVQVHPSHAGTRGGVVISPEGQVLRPDGSPIEGLFACGNTAANLLFGAGYGSGSAVGSSMIFGYLAARHLADR
ncbi:MAG TPA: FAD-binding protein [Galbitalea sp.]